MLNWKPFGTTRVRHGYLMFSGHVDIKRQGGNVWTAVPLHSRVLVTLLGNTDKFTQTARLGKAEQGLGVWWRSSDDSVSLFFRSSLYELHWTEKGNNQIYRHYLKYYVTNTYICIICCKPCSSGYCQCCIHRTLQCHAASAARLCESYWPPRTEVTIFKVLHPQWV